jgi:hypothetical protein
VRGAAGNSRPYRDSLMLDANGIPDIAPGRPLARYVDPVHRFPNNVRAGSRLIWDSRARSGENDATPDAIRTPRDIR